MRVLLVGAGGQLGGMIARIGADGCDLHAADRTRLDITDAGAVREAVTGLRPDIIINAAAYTAVDRAESEPEAAHAINVDGARHLAQAAAAVGAQMLHVSTDFVFDGRAWTPYAPDAGTNPLGVYGRTKRDGERAVMEAAGEHATVVRTSWVYGPGGHNFVRTMLRLIAERDEVTVVSDQIGAPTHTAGLAGALLALCEHPETGGRILHWSDAGAASWFDLADAVRAIMQRRWRHLDPGEVVPIFTEDFPTPAHRPPYSVLDCRAARDLLGCPPSWRERLEHALMRDDERFWLPASD